MLCSIMKGDSHFAYFLFRVFSCRCLTYIFDSVYMYMCDTAICGKISISHLYTRIYGTINIELIRGTFKKGITVILHYIYTILKVLHI